MRVTVVVGEIPCSMTETMMASSTWAWPSVGHPTTDDQVCELTETALADHSRQQLAANQNVVVSHLGDICRPIIGC